MTKKMLIDATHKEETRVAITDGNKLEEYEYESQSRKPLKGNIYLAKVTRVEPSLQAAFVNFGGNRHGFLPFSEIHPDYFRIPVSDREALMAEQEELLRAHDEQEALEDEEQSEDEAAEDTSGDAPEEPEEVGGEAEQVEDGADDESEAENSDAADDADENEDDVSDDEKSEDDNNDDQQKKGNRRGRGRGRGRGRNRRSENRNSNVEVVGGEEADLEQKFRFNLRRKYKIQEVIKRGQIMLIQVNKEERGNKGAAVGSYLSLPGRYCVLMPNSPRAGGVSRKIANYKDRARMREIVKDLEVPKGMSVIVRTAGVTRTKAEIKRDLDYLTRLWNNIRDLTLESTAPSLVYEEADLIKRSVRDLYTRDVEEIQVAGAEGFQTAKTFMKLMIPSHVKKVKSYEDDKLPLFHRYQIENQINEIGQTEVRLKSGGYLVINPTEALVSVDVNSGKATKGRHIEETALRTNLEAAEEVARQLRLRDLGGLVVIDFIDMEDRRSNGKVERRMKEALSNDRARVQVGRISSFGLMELSRQRLNPSLTEAQYEKCHNCNGMGLVRTADAMSVIVLRAIEEEGIRGRAAQIIVQVPAEVALYILNFMRNKLAEVESRYNLQVLMRVDEKLPASEYRIEVSMPATKDDDGGKQEDDSSSDQSESSNDDGNEKNEKSSRRGRRGGRRRSKKNAHDDAQNNDQSDDQVKDQKSEEKVEASDDASNEQDEKPKRKRRSPRKKKEDTQDESAKDADQDQAKQDDAVKAEVEEKPKTKRKPAAKKKKDDDKSSAKAANDEASEAEKPKKKPAAKKAAPKAKADKDQAEEPAPQQEKKVVAAASSASEYEVVNKAPEKKKKGWWNRLVE